MRGGLLFIQREGNKNKCVKDIIRYERLGGAD